MLYRNDLYIYNATQDEYNQTHLHPTPNVSTDTLGSLFAGKGADLFNMKDPAFLFYSDNFQSGTQFLTDEQTGKYIRLMCAQHLHGHLTEKQMLIICKSYDKDIWDKFTKDEHGNFFQHRLEHEISRRKSYSESRSSNRKGHLKVKKIRKSYVKHMGNENENEIESINTNKTELIYPFNSLQFMGLWDVWRKYKHEQFNFKYKHIGEQGALKELSELSKGNEETAIKIINQSIQKGWKGFFNLQTNGKQQITDDSLKQAWADDFAKTSAKHT